MGTFVEVPLPPGRKAVKSKWVFKKKTLADGSLDKYKARVVAKGFSQRYGEDYTETFSPVVRQSTVRVVLVVVVTRRMKRLQLDIKTAFLNSTIQEEIYMEPVEGYENDDGYVWLLKRDLYGLKQASRSWYEKLRADETLMIILVYVDDISAFAMRDADLFDFKASMEATFEVNIFNDINYFLGLELQWSFSGDEVRVSQHKYADTILDRFGMKNVRPAATPMDEQYRNCLFQEQDLTTFKPRPALGALLYLLVLTRPDISTAVRLLAQETERPTAALKVGIENVFRYLKSTKEYGLVIRDGTEHDGLVVYRDAAFAVERERKYSTGFAIFYDGNLVEWGSKKQGTVTLSSTEDEYITMATGLQECIGIMLVLKDLGIVTKNIVVMEDNQGARHLAESKGVTQRSRHIDTKYHWLREKVSDGLNILLSL
ncbi:hypothetical protein PsorP6_011913 [Peronosclerospora sorghi]|uniref:Uncharacterized protein n=1 Tax=Peronosclerospora sorghi TaxID=230839 RepID=A0ACC0WJE1_9STRA|nr:hypothetical protein PsorP6_011913 [Peronosclerospora sorghi]